MTHNLTVSSWNINALGDKCRDDFFISCLNSDINILLETWKGTDAQINLSNFNVIQKCRKKSKRSRRFSGGIIIFYKSKLHKGIVELTNISTSKNRIWLKMEKDFFGFKKDLYLCACYIPPFNSPFYDDDFIKLENEIIQLSDKGDIALIGDLNARTANRLDFIDNERHIHDALLDILPTCYLHDSNIERRNSVDSVFNSQGQQLLDLCIASQLRILNGRYLGDTMGNMTCFKPNGASTVDYALANVDLIKSVNFFQTLVPTYLSDHVQIVLHLKCHIKDENHNTYYKSFKINSIFKWENVSKTKLLNALGQENIREDILNFECTNFEKDTKWY